MRQITKIGRSARIVGIVDQTSYFRKEALKQLALCGLVEFRADTFPAETCQSALADFLLGKGEITDAEVVLTVRLNRDGGHWSDSRSASRWEFLDPILEKWAGRDDGVAWLDLEVECLDEQILSRLHRFREKGMKLLVSHHDFERGRTLEEYRLLLANMSKASPDGVKFAMACQGPKELVELCTFAADVGPEMENSCIISMGRIGTFTRILSPVLGCTWTYGFLGDTAVAPGQISVGTLISAIEELALIEPPMDLGLLMADAKALADRNQ